MPKKAIRRVKNKSYVLNIIPLFSKSLRDKNRKEKKYTYKKRNLYI